MNLPLGTSSNTSPASAATRRLLISWLLMILVGVLLFLLSGGMPPTAWQLLLQMLSRWRDLQAALGGGVILPLIVVSIQSLLILIAWGMLAFTIWREVAVFKTIRARQRILRLQKDLAVPESLPTSDAVSESHGVQLVPEELFEEDTSISPKNTGIQIVSFEDDLFDESTAVFELSSSTNESGAEEEALVSAERKNNKEEEREPVFVYGNPFDGSLPEVFEYDMDLKREVQNLQENQRKQQELGGEGIVDNDGGQSGPEI